MKKGELGRAQSVRFETSSIEASCTRPHFPPPSISSPGVWAPLVAPSIDAVKSELGTSVPTTRSARATTAPPGEFLSPAHLSSAPATFASTTTAPVPKAKTKGKQKVQSQQSSVPRATSTPPMVPSPRPKTRSMSAAMHICFASCGLCARNAGRRK